MKTSTDAQWRYAYRYSPRFLSITGRILEYLLACTVRKKKNLIIIIPPATFRRATIKRTKPALVFSLSRLIAPGSLSAMNHWHLHLLFLWLRLRVIRSMPLHTCRMAKLVACAFQNQRLVKLVSAAAVRMVWPTRDR